MCLLLVGNMIIAALFLVALIALVVIVDIFASKIWFLKGHVNIVRLVISGLILMIIGWCLLSGLNPTMPVEKINDDIRGEQLFVNVRQDSLQQFMEKKNLSFKSSGLFSNKATLQIPISATSASSEITAELDTLARSFNKKLQVEVISNNEIKLKCPANKKNGVTYVSVPAVVMFNLMEQDFALEASDNFKPQISNNSNRR